jgi:tRNA threonylcarbamoyl adenosine modification protein YeaZ
MKILVLESSTEPGSWAVVEKVGDGMDLLQKGFCGGRTSATLAHALQTAGVLEWDEIWVGTGPGSFSGIRVAVATALGLAAARGCPVRAVRSTHALAWQFRQASCLGVFADARRGKVFFTAYELGRLVRPTGLWGASALEDALGKCSRAVSIDGLPGVPETVAPEAWNLAQGVHRLGLWEELPLEPVYLHPVLESKV